MSQDPFSWIPQARPYDSARSGQAAYSQSQDSAREALVALGEWDPAWDEQAEPSGLTDPGEKKTLDWGDAWGGGFGDVLGDLTPFVAGVKELSEAKGLWEAADRVKNETATPEDFELIQSYMEEASSDKTVGYHIGSILRQLPAFGVELWAGMGAARAGTKAAAKLGIESLQAGLEKTIKQRGLQGIAKKLDVQAAALEAAGETVEAATKRKAAKGMMEGVVKHTPAKAIGEAAKLATASTIGSEAITSVAGGVAGQGWGGRSQADAYRRAFQKAGMYMDKDEAGNLSLKLSGELESFWDSLPAGIANTFVEHMTERMGGTLMAMPLVNRLEGWQAAIATRFMGKNKMKPAEFMEFLDKFGWDGPIEEFMEERAGGWIRGITFVGEDEWYVGEGEDGYYLKTEQFIPDVKQWAGELSAFAITGQGASALHSYFSGESDPLAGARGARTMAEVETAAFRQTFEQKLIDNPEIGPDGLNNLRSGNAGQEEYDRIFEIIEGDDVLREAASDAGIRGFRGESLTVDSVVAGEATKWVQDFTGSQEATGEIVPPSTAYQRQIVEQFKDYADVVFVEGDAAFEGSAAAHYSKNTEGGPGVRGTVYINAGLREDTAEEGAVTLLKKAFHESIHDYQFLDERNKTKAIEELFAGNSSLAESARIQYFSPFILNERVTTVEEKGVEGEEGWSRETVEDAWSPNYLMLTREEKLAEIKRYQEEIWNPKQESQGNDPKQVEKDELEATLAEEYTELIEFLHLENGQEYIDRLKKRDPRVIEHIRDFFVRAINRFRSEDSQISTGVEARIERLGKQLMGTKITDDSFKIATAFKDAMGVLGGPLQRRSVVSDGEQAAQDAVADRGEAEDVVEPSPTAEEVQGVERERTPRPDTTVSAEDIADAKPFSQAEQDAIDEIRAGEGTGTATVEDAELVVQEEGVWRNLGDSSYFVPREDLPEVEGQLDLFGEVDLSTKKATELREIAKEVGVPTTSDRTVDGTPLTGKKRTRLLKKDELLEALEQHKADLATRAAMEAERRAEQLDEDYGTRESAPQDRESIVKKWMRSPEYKAKMAELAKKYPDEGDDTWTPTRGEEMETMGRLKAMGAPKKESITAQVMRSEKNKAYMEGLVEKYKDEPDLEDELGASSGPFWEPGTPTRESAPMGNPIPNRRLLLYQTPAEARTEADRRSKNDPEANYEIYRETQYAWGQKRSLGFGVRNADTHYKVLADDIGKIPLPPEGLMPLEEAAMQAARLNREYPDKYEVYASPQWSFGQKRISGYGVRIKENTTDQSSTRESAPQRQRIVEVKDKEGNISYKLVPSEGGALPGAQLGERFDPDAPREVAPEEERELVRTVPPQMIPEQRYAPLRLQLEKMRGEYDAAGIQESAREDPNLDRLEAFEEQRAKIQADIGQLEERRAQVREEVFGDIFPKGSESEVARGYHAIGVSPLGVFGGVEEYLAGPFATKEEAAQAVINAGFIYGPGINLQAIAAEGVEREGPVRAMTEADQQKINDVAQAAHEASYPEYLDFREGQIAMHERFGENWRSLMSQEQKGRLERREESVGKTITGRGFNRLNLDTGTDAGTPYLNKDSFTSLVMAMNELRYRQEHYDQPIDRRTGNWNVEIGKTGERSKLKSQAAARERVREKAIYESERFRRGMVGGSGKRSQGEGAPGWDRLIDREVVDPETGALRVERRKPGDFSAQDLDRLVQRRKEEISKEKRRQNIRSNAADSPIQGESKERLNELGSLDEAVNEAAANLDAARETVFSGVPSIFRMQGKVGIEKPTGQPVNREIQIMRGHDMFARDVTPHRFGVYPLSPREDERFEYEEVSGEGLEEALQPLREQFAGLPTVMAAQEGLADPELAEQTVAEYNLAEEELLYDRLYLQDEAEELTRAQTAGLEGEGVSLAEMQGADPARDILPSDRLGKTRDFFSLPGGGVTTNPNHPAIQSDNLKGSWEPTTIPGEIEEQFLPEGEVGTPVRDMGDATPATNLRSTSDLREEERIGVLSQVDHFQDWDYANNRPYAPYSTDPRDQGDRYPQIPGSLTNVREPMRAIQRDLVSASEMEYAKLKEAHAVLRDVLGKVLDETEASRQQRIAANPDSAESQRLARLGLDRRRPQDVVKAYGHLPLRNYMDVEAYPNLISSAYLEAIAGHSAPTIKDLWAGYKNLQTAARNKARIARNVFNPDRIGATFGINADSIRRAQNQEWSYTYVVQGESMRAGKLPYGQLVSQFAEGGGFVMTDGTGRSIPIDKTLADDILFVLEESNSTKDIEHFKNAQSIATSSGIARLTENEAGRLEELGYKLRPLDGLKRRHFYGQKPFSALMAGSMGNNREYFLRNPNQLDTWLLGIFSNVSHNEMVEMFGVDIFTLSKDERFTRVIQRLENEDLIMANYVLGHFVSKLNEPGQDNVVASRVNLIARVLFENRESSLGGTVKDAGHSMLLPGQEQRRRMRFFAQTGRAMPRSFAERGVAQLPANYPGTFFGGPQAQPIVAELPGVATGRADEYEREVDEALEFGQGEQTRESAPQMSPFAREVLQGEEHSKYTAWQRFLEKAANRYLPLTDWERRLEAKGIEIPRHMRIALKQAMKRGELSQEQSIIERKFFKPLQDAILNRGKKKLGFGRKMSFKDAEDIAKNKAATEKHNALMPRQGEERSPQLRSRPAWITPREAEAAIAKYERKYGKEHVDAVEKAIMDISAETRRIWRRAELVPSGLIDFLEESYPHYVPYSEQEMFELEPWKNAYDQEAIQEGGVARSMRGFLEALGTDGMFGEERGSDMRQPMFRTMLGITKAPKDSSLLMLMGQLNQALNKELDAKISRAVVDLIELGQQHGIGNIATIVPEEKQTRWAGVERRPEDGEEKRVMATEVRDLSFKENPLVYVAAGPDGTRQVIEFHPKFQQIADALKNENMPAFQKLKALDFLSKMTRFIGGMITRWNPAFSIPNFVRDTATASAHITAEYGPKVASEMFLNKSMLASILTLWKVNGAIANGTYDPDLPEFANDPDMVMFERYKASGAPVTFLDLGKTRGLEDWFREVHQVNNPPQLHQVQFWKGKVSTLKGYIENFNDAFENAARFAFFKYGIEKGIPSKLVEGENMDDQELGLAAKSLTVNFESKGTIGASMNGLFMFFNANIQSNARLIEAIFSRDKKGDRSFQPYAKQLIGSIITLHAAVAVMNAAIGGEDPEDDEKYWAKIPDWDKRANLILMNWMGQDGKAIKVPLPYGYNFFAAIGNMFGEVWSGTKRGEDVAPYLFETGLQAFSPVGGGTDFTDMITPTVVKPLFEIRNNRDWKGSAIYKDRYGDETIPDSELAFDSVNKNVQEFTTWLNEATGGNQHRAGELLGVDTSINPATIEHFAQFLGGGIGKELFRGFKIREKISEGEELEIGDIPLLRRFALAPTKYAAASLYRDRRDQILQVERTRKAGLPLSEEDRKLLRLSAAKRSSESSIKKIRQRRRLYERGSEQYKKLEERERSVQNAFNKRWNRVMSS